MLKFTKRLIIAVCVTCFVATAQAQQRPPEEISFDRGPAPARYTGYATYLASVATDVNDTKNAMANLYLTQTVRRGEERNFSYKLEGIRRGDILPAMGELYRVDSITSGRAGRMSWKRLDRDKWPEKVSTNFCGIAVFLKRRDLDCYSYTPDGVGFRITLTSIDGNAGKLATLSAKLQFWQETKTGFKGTEATAKVDDILLIDGKGHKVLSIVPANEKTGVVGWVELDAVGIPEAELKRDKKAYLTPTPVKK